MKKMLIAGLMICASVTVYAEGSQAGVYAGIDAVATTYNYELGDITRSNHGNTTNLGVKFVLGYNLAPNWAIEGGYANLGSQTRNYNDNTYDGRIKMSANSVYAAVKGSLPVNPQFSVYGKLGIARNHQEVKGVLTEIVIAPENVYTTLDYISGKENQTDLYSAVGAQYTFTKNLSVTLELERFGKERSNGFKNTSVSTGLRYSF